MSIWPLSTIERYVQRRELRKGAEQEHVHAVAEYKHPHNERMFQVFFVENGNQALYCVVEKRDAQEAETETSALVDGIAWCQQGKLPAHARPMDRLPEKGCRSQKRFYDIFGPGEYEVYYQAFGNGRAPK